MKNLAQLTSILLVDDDEEDYLITRDIVEEVNHRRYTLDWVQSYEQALGLIRARSHDVYLIDYRLGALSGLDLIQEAIEAGVHAPLILLTGQGDIEIDEQAAQAGAADYLVKSQLTADRLERSIRYSIKQARSLSEIRLLNAELEARVERRTHALQKAINDLGQSQQLYRSIANNFPNGAIVVLDDAYRYVFADGQELRVLGLDKHELIGQRITELFPENQIPVVTYYLQRVFEGEPLSFELSFDQNTYSFRGVPLEDYQGDIHQILVVFTNITKQKKADQEIRRALRKEKQLNELKSRFTAMASHEFRTPLSTILSSVSLISRYPKEEQEPKRQKHIERVKSAVSNLTAILDDFLSLSKLEEGKILVRPSSFLLPDFCEEVLGEMSTVAKPGQQLIHEHQGPTEVYLDKHLTKNILLNLLSNAIKYSGEGKEIHLTTTVSGHHVTLRVRDQGIGIPEEEQVHLFERFYRANNATNIQGTGLGLNIVQKYVSLMSGKVEFESVLNQGTTFTVRLPRLSADAEVLPSPQNLRDHL